MCLQLIGIFLFYSVFVNNFKIHGRYNFCVLLEKNCTTTNTEVYKTIKRVSQVECTNLATDKLFINVLK